MNNDSPAWLKDDDESGSSSAASGDINASQLSNTLINNSTIQTTSKVLRDPVVQRSMLENTNASEIFNDNTPDWAKPQTPSTATDTEDVEVGVVPSESTNPYGKDISKEELDKIKWYHIGLRVAYMISAIIMLVASILTLSDPPNIALGFFAFYVLMFALLIFSFEIHLSGVAHLIAVNFGFMYSLIGRLLFLCFVGFMTFQLGEAGIAAMALLAFSALLHGALIYKFPFFQEYQRMLHYDIKRYGA